MKRFLKIDACFLCPLVAQPCHLQDNPPWCWRRDARWTYDFWASDFEEQATRELIKEKGNERLRYFVEKADFNDGFSIHNPVQYVGGGNGK